MAAFIFADSRMGLFTDCYTAVTQCDRLQPRIVKATFVGLPAAVLIRLVV